MDDPRAGERFERTVRWRSRRHRDMTMAGPIAGLEGLVKSLAKSRRGESSVDRAWASAAPPELAAGCEVVGYARGTLTLKARDASVKYLVERFLRSGGRQKLSEGSAVTIRKVKVVM